MARPVSIIVPCCNAERWVAEAIQSCLDQTYRPIEVIVIDDGSTDMSLDAIKSFGDVIRWETGPNRGGNHARNRGFELAKGEYVQFLDADDYVLPEKIEIQAAGLESSKADVVYGDWRHLSHLPDGRAQFEEITVSGEHMDMLASLLEGWWVASNAVLLRREAVSKIGGWDESLTAAQDTDFMMRLALAGSHFVYEPGCHSIYRRYGKVTVGTSNPRRCLENHCRVLDKAVDALKQSDRLTPTYGHALAHAYFRDARGWFNYDRNIYDQTMSRVFELEPRFQPEGHPFYKAAQRLFGYKGAEWLAYSKRRLLSRV